MRIFRKVWGYWWLAVLVFVSAVVLSGTLRAVEPGEVIGGILELMIQSARQEAQKKAYQGWAAQPEWVIACVRKNFNIEPNTLIQNGIGPNDKRVRSYVAACQEAYRQAQQRQVEEQELRERQAREEQERQEKQAQEAAERQRREIEAAKAAERRAQEERRAREEAERRARIAMLESQFPADWVPKIIAGEVALGWTPAAVRASLGAPGQMMRTPDGSEMWIYGQRRIIFTGGRVSYIQN